MDKSAVRDAGRRARRLISGSERVRSELLITSHLLSLPSIRGASLVGAFVAHDGEPDPGPLVERLRTVGVRLALPTLTDDGPDGAISYVEWEESADLVPGRFAIPVPAAGRFVIPDVVLVPFTGFDAAGHRIGRGKGFFDRFLATFDGGAVGVGFEAQRFDDVPVDSNDVALGTVVTELGVRFIASSDGP